MGDVIKFDGMSVPAHIADQFGGEPGDNFDLSQGVGAGGYPSLSIKGKVWHIVSGDEKKLITHEDGEPRSAIQAVILKANPNLSKVYYKSGYEEGSTEKPTCFSNDSKAPDRQATEPQSLSCPACPHNEWGSRITEAGKKGKACVDSRRLAVAPIGDLENPMLLRIPADTLQPLAQYAEMLNKRKAPHKAIVTKLGFDHTVAHPRLTFAAERWLDAIEAAKVVDTLKKDIIDRITGVSDAHPATPLQIAGTPPAELMENTVEHPKPSTETKTQEVAEAPVEKKEVTKPDTTSIIAEANASLDSVLSMLDD